MSPKQPERVESWFCDQCAAIGTLRGPASADVLSMSAAREQSHKNKSPDCHQKHGAAGVRVVDSGAMPS